MNREMILRVADAIEAATMPEAKPALGFNMVCYIDPSGMYEDKSGHDCGTTACIAGWVMHVSGVDNAGILEEDEADNFEDRGVPEKAKAILGLDGPAATELFHPIDRLSDWSAITPAEAVAVLRHLAETNQVDWSVAPERRS